jgi:hypothetical protein
VLPAAADAWLEQNSPTNNKGDDSILKVKAQRSNDNFRTVVRFAAVTPPDGCELLGATLRLYADSARAGRTLLATASDANWAEQTVTWATQPAFSGLVAIASSRSGYVTWDVLPVSGPAIQAGDTASFVIMDARENIGNAEQSFFAREKGERPPQLVLSFGPA